MLGTRHYYPLAGIAFVAVGLMLGPATAFSATKKKSPSRTAAIPVLRLPRRATCASQAAGRAHRRPNVLFLIADDLNDWWLDGRHPQARNSEHGPAGAHGHDLHERPLRLRPVQSLTHLHFHGIWP